MDIAKYIGLYLLKNRFCYVHGLGNMEIVKTPASHDGSELKAPVYQVKVTHGGSIDDNFANFIATNEQISISKAANTLREFSIQSRRELTEGAEIEIPSIGRFVERDGKVDFITDEHFSYTPAGIPTIKNSKQLEEQKIKLSHKPSYPAPAKADSVNWSMVILVIVLILVLAGGGYFIYTQNYSNDASITTDVVMEEPVSAPVEEPAPAPVEDTTTMPVADTLTEAPAPIVIDSNTIMEFRFIIGNYPTLARAERRVTMLTENGNKVEMQEKDTSNFWVVAPISCKVVDTAHVKDSLRIFFGYSNVRIIK